MKIIFFLVWFIVASLVIMPTFKTWKETIGYVFGSGIQAFEDGHFPTDFDVTRRLIALVDEERKKRSYSPVVAISNVAKELVEFWENHSSLPTKSTDSIGKKPEDSKIFCK